MISETERLELVPPTNPGLNNPAGAVELAELSSPYIQGAVDRMLRLSAGKGHNKHDSRQMVGLAAVQLGVPKRIITIDLTADGSNRQQMLQVVVNPVIASASTEMIPGREGCWSCGNICGNVERAKTVTLQGLNRNGENIVFDLVDFVARIAQHEVDHLDGIRFPDRIPANKPECLHWVEPAAFDEYRQHWAEWQELCPRDRWNELKAGIVQ